jgi:iron complex outermembrane receptor protein/vitamin B12 transporter
MASLSGTLVGRRDDSTFLSDANFGTTMLLPNRNLDPAYQRLDMGVSFRVNHYMSVYGLAQNLLSEHYYEAFGYQALPLTFHAGVRWTFGGESWSTK